MNDQILSAKTWQRFAERISVNPIGALPGSGISDDLKVYINNRDGGLCIYCKSDTYIQFDHVIPIAHGGPAVPENIVLACESCNSIKSNSFRIDFLTIAFNHLLYVGENIDWVDKIFIPFEDREDVLIDLKCENCGNIFRFHRFTNFCSDKCEDENFENEQPEERIKSECLMCRSIFFSEEEEDFCCNRCENRFEQEFDE